MTVKIHNRELKVMDLFDSRHLTLNKSPLYTATVTSDPIAICWFTYDKGEVNAFEQIKSAMNQNGCNLAVVENRTSHTTGLKQYIKIEFKIYDVDF